MRPSAIGLYLEMLSALAPAEALLEVRYRVRRGGFARFFLGTGSAGAGDTIVRIGRRADVFVGVAPRVHRGGGRDDVAPTALLWADCDGSEALASLRAFSPPPSALVASGSEDCAHAYWALTRALGVEQLEDANRRLAAVLGADPRCADAARVLRPPDTLNFKHHPPLPVRLLECTPVRYRPAELLMALPAASHPRASHARPGPGSRHHDPLLRIAPAHYVEALTGRRPGHDGKIHCPFHADRTPSFHAYSTPERGWTCFGCTGSTGQPLGGDIYMLASLLWGHPASGRDFITLRARLDAVFGVRRG